MSWCPVMDMWMSGAIRDLTGKETGTGLRRGLKLVRDTEQVNSPVRI